MPDLHELFVMVVLLAAAACSAVWLWRRDVFRPGSLDRRCALGQLRNPATVGPGVWLAGAVGVFLAAALAGGGMAAMLGVTSAEQASREIEVGAVIDVATYCVAAVVAVICIALMRQTARVAGASPRDLGLAMARKDALAGLGGLLLVLPLCAAAGIVSSQVARLLDQQPDPVAHTALRQIVDNRASWGAWMRAGMAILGAPAMEELIYRVFVQSAIISGLARIRWGRTHHGDRPAANGMDICWGIVLTSVIFLLPHSAAVGGPVSWHALPSLAVLSVALGVIYERTRSPLAPIVMHAGFNAVNVALAVLTAGAAR